MTIVVYRKHTFFSRVLENAIKLIISKDTILDLHKAVQFNTTGSFKS